MLIVKRTLANLVDIFLFFAIIIVFFLFVFPHLPGVGAEQPNFILAGFSLLTVVAVYFIIQYPFLANHQTVGKGFFGLKIVSTDDQRPLTVSIIIARELFGKVMTCYLMCIPVFFGLEGKHDEACSTKVI